MAPLWPIIVPAAVADALGWAHCIRSSCCRWHRSGPLFFWQMLPMPLGGPIALAGAPADGLALAHYVSGSCCQGLLWGHFLFRDRRPRPRVCPLPIDAAL